MSTSHYTPEQINRFWSKVAFTANPDKCWEWQGAVSGSGYGVIKIAKKNISPHRLSYELSYGDIQDGKFVLHKCDNRLCVNPAHLFLGTQRQNMDDCQNKNRNPHGESHGNAKLTWELVEYIREQVKAGRSRRSVAIEIGVTPNTTERVVNGITWRKH